MKTILIALLLPLAASASAATFTVDNTFDPGSGTCDAFGCTLREAIEAANANPGADLINFNIPAAGVQTITLTNGPLIITDTVTIDGYTQPEASANTLTVGNDGVLLIELDATLVGPPAIGLLIASDNNVIRGLVINRSTGDGIQCSGSNNIIEGNFIGTDAAGTAGLGNPGTGALFFSGTGNLIGGIAPAARNLISGNGVGVTVSGGSNNSVQGNYIGTDRNGLVPLPNGIRGVVIGASSDNLIGGTVPGSANLISGNGTGVSLSSATGNSVQGNFIGTDVTGTAALGNFVGIALFDSSNDLIGGTAENARNIISANTITGVNISNGSSGNTIQGNYIGTDVTGTVALGPDGTTGVNISDASDNLIGGAIPGAGNLISGNSIGVQLLGAATGNAIQGNFIGTDAGGTGPLGNGSGIAFFDTASGTTVGGPAGAGNVIAFNGNDSGGAGILVNGQSSTGHRIFGNSIFGNLELGIDLVGAAEDSNGVTANDAGDADDGPNALQNYPVISVITGSEASLTVEGTLDSVPNVDYTLDFYSNSEVDPSGYGEGETYLGALEVHTDAQGAVDFSFPLEASALGKFITATATDPDGNTSEFSQADEAVPALPPISRFQNISTRLRVQTGDNVLIGGFIITGSDPKQVLLRAIGPSLGGQGVADPLPDPFLELHYPDDTIVTNDNWRDTQEAEITASGIPPANNKESAILATLDPGAYTAIVRGAAGGSGVALVEAYDLAPAADSQLANISTRGLVETGDNVMIGGIIVGPEGAPEESILLRAIGPSLSEVGITNPLADPILELHDANGDLIVSNDNWKSTQQADIEATGIPPNDDQESAILATLAPGNYTAIMRGVGNTTGIGLIEAYHLD